MIEIDPKFIKKININGMSGRVLDLPSANSDSKKTIVLIYGHHSSLERMYSTAQCLQDYGRVVMPDLPGFGGMDSLFTIGKRPSIDELADYLYAVLRTQQLTKDTTVVAMSFGFLVYTRMLQKYPHAQLWANAIVSFVGFGQRKDFKVPQYVVVLSWILAQFGGSRFGAAVMGLLFRNRLLSWFFMRFYSVLNPKTKNLTDTSRREAIEMEVALWRANDPRTHFYTLREMIALNLTDYHAEKISVPLHDMYTAHDQYFDHSQVQQTLGSLYEEVFPSELNMELHAPSVIGEPDDVRKMLSEDVKAMLSK